MGDFEEAPKINFDPSFNPRKYLYSDDLDVDDILTKIRGEKITPVGESSYSSPVDALRIRLIRMICLFRLHVIGLNVTNSLL